VCVYIYYIFTSIYLHMQSFLSLCRLGDGRGGACEAAAVDVQALRRQMSSVVEEYLCSNDVPEVRRRLRELNVRISSQDNIYGYSYHTPATSTATATTATATATTAATITTTTTTTTLNSYINSKCGGVPLLKWRA